MAVVLLFLLIGATRKQVHIDGTPVIVALITGLSIGVPSFITSMSNRAKLHALTKEVEPGHEESVLDNGDTVTMREMLRQTRADMLDLTAMFGTHLSDGHGPDVFLFRAKNDRRNRR